MAQRDYWLDLFTGTTWQEFTQAGATTSGFRENRWSVVQQIKVGDYLLCYMTGISRFIGVLEATSEPYRDATPIWQIDAFPCRLRVKPVVMLTPETAVPILDMRDSLSIFQNLQNPNAWIGRVRGSPAKWKRSDGEKVVETLLEAQRNPVERPVDARKLARRPPSLVAGPGEVTVPAPDEPQPTPEPAEDVEVSIHTEIQYLLLRLGADMGFDVWVARNDRNRIRGNRPLSDMFKFKDALPRQFDEATTRTIEYIDVLWLKGNAIVAAFEIESTTSIYSGLLRMSDLVAMQPNLNIPLYLVAPDERRDKVFQEVNRPTFARPPTPLANVCRYISFSTLQDKVKEVGPYSRYLRETFLDELAEVCEV
ncbi:MAG: EVE domain-containing protein [Chloroflexota bacterium]|nr:EVE domain-containing protein [Chloroflexota bacterium]